VLTASDDSTARLWDAASGQELRVLRGHEAPVFSAVFSPDGARVLTASEDNTARLWPEFTSVDAMVSRVRDCLPRQLSPGQRQRFYLPDSSPRSSS
jgi:WD40 repeat protein